MPLPVLCLLCLHCALTRGSVPFVCAQAQKLRQFSCCDEIWGLGFRVLAALMADSDAAAVEFAPASAQSEESPLSISAPPSSSSSAPAAAPPETTSPPPAPLDPLAKALQTLFLDVTTLVQGELQAVNSEYELLEMINLRVASEHDNQADFAEGLRVFVERLKQKNEGFSEYLQQIDEIDQEVTELEALVSTLDNYTSNLESKIRIACTHSHGRQFM